MRRHPQRIAVDNARRIRSARATSASSSASFALRQLAPPGRRRDLGAEAVEECADLHDGEPRLLGETDGAEKPNDVGVEPSLAVHSPRSGEQTDTLVVAHR